MLAYLMYLLEHHAEARARFSATGVKDRLSPLRDVLTNHPENAQLEIFVDKICGLIDGTTDRIAIYSVSNNIAESDDPSQGPTSLVKKDSGSSRTLCQNFLDLLTPYNLFTVPLLLGFLAWKAYAAAHSQPISNTLDWIISIVFFAVYVTIVIAECSRANAVQIQVWLYQAS